MRIIRSIKKMIEISRRNIASGKTTGFVPTMGALHAGHASLIRKARRENDCVVVSIFVNPSQFGPKEDFRKYPRNLKEDKRLCKKAGVDIIFYPEATQMYPAGYKTYVEVEDLSNKLCGKFRPGHFKGVATVVLKLFNIIRPDTAYLGQKDAQQAIIIKKMVEDLNLAIKIKVLETVRQKDGLPLSSRNSYLSKEERACALVLSSSLELANQLIKKGLRDPSKIISRMKEMIAKKDSSKIDYISIVDPQILEQVKKIRKNCLIALAVWIGKTRLIDNAIVRL